MVEEIINKWLGEVEDELVINYDRLGLRASGRWAKSLEPFQRREGGTIKLGILGENYTDYIENGRGPNKDQTEEGLKAWVGWAGSTFLDQWVKDKQVNLNPFAVAWKKAREGWEVPNKHNAGGLVSDVVTRKKMGELNRSLVFSLVQDFKSAIIKELK
jgi:hypothetical protein